jgi:hypothetical protein
MDVISALINYTPESLVGPYAMREHSEKVLCMYQKYGSSPDSKPASTSIV